MPQLDSSVSIHAKRKQPILMIRRGTTLSGGGYPDESDSDSHGDRSHEDGRYPGRQGYYQERSGRPPDRHDNQGRGYLRGGRPPDGGRPPNDGGPPDGGMPPDNGGPPSDGGPPDDGGPSDSGGPPGNG